MYQVLNVEQTEIYTTGDSTTHVRAYLVCDTTADLPGINDISGYTLEMGSRALVIQDAAKYCMQSDGTWTLQQTADLQSIITQLSDIDDRLNDTTADATWAKSQIELFIKPAVISLIDTGAKNIVENNLMSKTRYGVTATTNADGTITITGASTSANDFILVYDLYDEAQSASFNSSIPAPEGEFVCPPTENLSVRLQVLNYNSSSDYAVKASSDSLVAFSFSKQYMVFRIWIKSTADFSTPVVIKPMVCLKDYWNISENFAPYAPTNRQLLDLIRSYHP